LLIVGSPKIDEPSTSGVLGDCLAIVLKERGWETESLVLRTSLNSPEGERELLAAVERAGLIVLAFPLYADALPYLATKALALIAAHRANGEPSGKRLVGIVNSGLPEAHQNSVALAICREFAVQSGLDWAGALSLGGGGLIGGQTLTGRLHSGPPVRDLMAALETTGAALAEGMPVPASAAAMVARKRIPFGLWRRLHAWMGGRAFEKAAAKNGVLGSELLARPDAGEAGDAAVLAEPVPAPLP
jgi:hypothetical protein